MADLTQVPRWVQGAWRREGSARGQASLVERCDVLWLQTPTYFADLRVPNQPVEDVLDELDEAQAFSGVGVFRSHVFTWIHDIDTRRRPDDRPDVATLEADSTLLFERGEGYLERWRREEVRTDFAVADWNVSPSPERRASAPSGRIVVVGHLAIGVWSKPSAAAAGFVRMRAGWSTTATIGRVPQKEKVLTGLLGALDRDEALAAGWTRRPPQGENR